MNLGQFASSLTLVLMMVLKTGNFGFGSRFIQYWSVLLFFDLIFREIPGDEICRETCLLRIALGLLVI